MAINGNPTILTHLRLSSAIAGLRQQSETARTELVTGRKSDLLRSLGNRVSDAQLLQAAIEGLELQRNAIAKATLRGAAAQSALASIGSDASRLNADLLSAIGRGDEQAISLASNEAREGLQNAFARLNLRIEGSAIFSGDAGDRNPFGDLNALLADVAGIYAGAPTAAQLNIDLDFYFNDPAGGFSTSIYQGGSGQIGSIDIAPGEAVRVTAKADEQAIKDLLRGLSVIVIAGADAPSPKKDAALSDAAAQIDNAADGIVSIRARIGIEEQRAEEVNARLTAEEPVLTNSYNALTAADPFETSLRLQSLESQIEASFVLTSRLSRLSLVNFI